MELWWFQIPPGIAAIGVMGLFSIVAVAFFFISRQASKGAKTAEQNKVLLKQLLEGFGLEVPTELKEPESVVLKSIKTN